MQKLTQQGQQAIQNIASRYNLSESAVIAMLHAVLNGGGTMAQFNIPELGGGGQWMQGGMTMVGDMFNTGLQGTVSNLCGELSNLSSGQNLFEAPAPGTNNSGNWWPSEFGMPNSSGGQNNTRYAYFAQINRLAIDDMGEVSVYDTLDHQIGGVSQQQGGGSTVQFTSQYGTLNTLSLPLISGKNKVVNTPEPPAPLPAPEAQREQPTPASQNNAPSQTANSVDIYDAIEKLGHLHNKGILTDAEFNTKKAELLARL